MKLTIGTRGSALALWQARYVAGAIENEHPDIRVELMKIKTRGDKILDTPLALIGGKGLFTKEIEEALLDGRVDLAVHSMKDLPTELPEGLRLAAVLEREDPRDVFVSRDGRSLKDLDPGDAIGTSSLRRKAFLLNRYPHLEITPIRGNVDTRVRKSESEDLAGVILAAAGIKRMRLTERVTEYISTDLIIPAIGQGAMGIETRENDPEVDDIVSLMNHRSTAACIGIERAFLQRMGGGCQVPLAAHAEITGDKAHVTAAVVHPQGEPIIRTVTIVDSADNRVGTELADTLIGRGADQILKRVLGDDWAPGQATSS
jgi:hydroxymethylbilane synthase